MKKYFIAKTIKDKEYCYSIDSAMFTSEKNKDKFCKFLNDKKYNLKNDNEIWYVYKNDYYANDRIFKEIKQTKTRIFIRWI